MRAVTCFILLFLVVASGAAYLQGERESGVIAYWREKLPTTPIPQSLTELISPDYDKEAVMVSLIRLVHEMKSIPKTTFFFDYHSYRINYGSDVQIPKQMPTHSSFTFFLLEKNLVNGTKVSLTFSNKQKTHFIPRSVADEIPFCSHKLDLSLKELDIGPDSHMNVIMKDTLKICETPSIKGETKYCATSLESMVDFTTSKLGSNRLTLLATNLPKASKPVKQEYAIVGMKYESEVEKPAYVCHLVRYAYVVYYCHGLHGTKVARVWVKGEDGSTVEAVTICHTDTSGWHPKHVALQELKVKPGEASVCHFIPENHLVWLAAS